MALIHTNILVHILLVVQNRQEIIEANLMLKLTHFINEVLLNKKNQPLAVNGYKNHIHIFIRLNPTSNISDIVRDIKSRSSKWLNQNKAFPKKFSWQPGYCAFGHTDKESVNLVDFIKNQHKYHEKTDFRNEFRMMLKRYNCFGQKAS